MTGTDFSAGPSFGERLSDEKYGAGTEIERTSKAYTRARVPAGRPLRVLDIGCGTGVNAVALAAMGHTVSGVDISQVAVDRFREHGFEGVRCDAVDGLPFDAASFDVVFSSEIIEHVVDTQAFLAEALRTLKPGGLLVCSTPNSAFWVYRLLALLGRTVTDVQHRGHVRFFSRRGLDATVREAGFEGVSISARHMYLILGDRLGRLIAWLPGRLGLRSELRFRTGKPYWHLSRFAPRAGGFWADTLILTARRPAGDRPSV